MKRSIFIALLVITSFGSGFALRGEIAKNTSRPPAIGRVTGIGGIFFKCKEPAKVRAWYQQHLGINMNPYGAVFEWHQGADSLKKGFTQWSVFKATTIYFAPSDKDFMINYRVDNMNALLTQLRKDSVTVVDSVQTADYGKFVHIMDIEGNKIELWEPNDVAYEKMGMKMGAKTTK